MNNQQSSFHAGNRKKLIKVVRKINPDCSTVVIIGNSFLQASADRAYPFEQDSNFYYLTGVMSPGFILVIDEDGEYLIAPPLDEIRKAFEGSVDNNALSDLSGIRNIYQHEEGWVKLKKAVTKSSSIATLLPPDSYVERHDMFTNPSRQRLLQRITEISSQINIVDVRKELAVMRMIKQEYEINLIEEAIARTTILFQKLDGLLNASDNERELMAEAVRQSILLDAPHAYEPIIASGLNAVTLHYIDNNAKIDKNKLLLLDIGLRYKGYSADITRAVSFNPTSRQKEIYDAVLKVQTYALTLLKPGISMREYEKNVQEYMVTTLYELNLIAEKKPELAQKYYPHSTSHFLGIDVHDVGDYDRPLEPGVVLTVEPGIYIEAEEIGIRIEDDVVITEDGNRILTNKLPRDLASLTIKS